LKWVHVIKLHGNGGIKLIEIEIYIYIVVLKAFQRKFNTSEGKTNKIGINL